MRRKLRRWKIAAPVKAWAVKWRSKNQRDGENAHLLREPVGFVKQFRTRSAARTWMLENHVYIKIRPDLQAEPHGWRLPEVVRIEIRELRRKRK